MYVHHPYSIVILDHTPTNRKILQTSLQREGFHVVTYAQARTALQALLPVGNPLPDLLILELDLPILDGIAVIKAVRKKSKTMPILVITVRDRILDRILARLAGANAYMTKPYRVQEVSSQIQVLLHKHKCVLHRLLL